MSEIFVVILVLLVNLFGISHDLGNLVTQDNFKLVDRIVFDGDLGSLLGELGEVAGDSTGVDEGSESETGTVEGETAEVGELQKVTRVIDGDTIELESGQKLRYIGIDTPETKHPTKEDGCFGKEASEFNKGLVEGKMVKLEKDYSETDRYGRLLRYVYLDDIFVNEYLVREGYAVASSFPPDIMYQEIFKEAEIFARENEKGLWGEVCDN